MKRAVAVLLIGFVAFGIGTVFRFYEAQANTAVIRDGIGEVTLVNAEWVALLVLAAVCGATALVLAYLASAVDVLASLRNPESVAEEPEH